MQDVVEVILQMCGGRSLISIKIGLTRCLGDGNIYQSGAGVGER